MFQDKLITALKASTAWTELADALESLNSSVIEPYIQRLQGLTSVFTMHTDDLQVRFDELGAYYSVGETEDEDIPLLLQQRIDEMHFKGYKYPLTKTFEREFLGVSLSWQQCYAPKDFDTYPYGTSYVLQMDIEDGGLDFSDYFKTQRGVIYTSLSEVIEQFDSLDDFEELIDRVITPLIPTHIAYDGQQYYLSATLYDRSYIATYTSTEIQDNDSATDKTYSITNDSTEITLSGGNELVSDSPPADEAVITFDDYPLDAMPLEINYIRGTI